jgi:putative DNA primase/helicase
MATFDLADLHDVAVRNKRSAAACSVLRWVVVPWQMRDGRRKVPTRSGWTQAGALRGPEIGEWFANNPNDIPGVVTGEESGIWVLDIDPRNGGTDSLARLDSVGALGKTFRVDTPSGGWHLYFSWPSGGGVRSVNNLPGYPGLDVKGHGGFVGAPGATVFEVGEYRAPIGPASILAAPDWLLEIVRVGSPTFSVDGQDWSEVDGTEAPDQTWLQWQLDQLGNVPPGGQHDALRWFTLQMRRRGMRQADAEAWAGLAAERFLSDPGRQPWTVEDGRRIVIGTWARIAPGVVEAELAGWAAGQGEAQPLPAPVGETAQPLPAPVAAARVLGEPPGTIGPDDENGQEFRIFAADHLIWLAGGDWYAWDGQRWSWDKSLTRNQLIRDFGHSLVRRAGGDVDEDERKRLVSRYTSLGTVGGRDRCLNYAKDLFSVTADQLDSDVWALNTLSGLVDLRTGDVRPAEPRDLVTKLASTEWEAGARDETWERVLAEMIESPLDRAWIRRWAGYCLTGHTMEKAILMMHGLADSGKSTVTSPFQLAMGDYAVVWKPSMLLAKQENNVDAELFRAMGARLIVVPEFPRAGRLDESIMKMMTGTDRVMARALYQASVEYIPQFKLWIHTNHLPGADEEALMKRMRFFGMRKALPIERRDDRIKTWLESPGPRAAIMWWAWQGLDEMTRLGGLGKPESSDSEVAYHQLLSDPLRRFMDETLEPARDGVVAWDMICMAYAAWCAGESLKPLGTGLLAHRLSERGVEKVRYRDPSGIRYQAIQGWQLRMNNDADASV